MNPPELYDVARVTRRRMDILIFVVATTMAAALGMADLTWGMPMRGWNGVMLGLYVVLFAFTAIGAAQALFGFVARRRGGDPSRLTATLEDEIDASVALGRTAIVLPICNEESHRVYAGLRAIYRSVQQTGQLAAFDFFILSDSNDPNKWVQEELGWVKLSQELDARGKIFYRRRSVRVSKKAGNIADFCRRWGRRYHYMIVLDADSLMAGETLVKMVRLLDRNPQVGIVQTAPTLIRGETLFARVLQFGTRVYGPIFQAGLNYWQQGNGNYWGHNAAIRLAPFMKHASLPNLPGVEPLGGKILSHDFVEAALMLRAGWQVWMLPDVGGSYEEGPPTLIDSAKRDRRWCQGNLQHTWLLFARGLHPISRVHLVLGIASYFLPLLWLIFMLTGSLLMVGFDRTGLTWVPTPGFATTLGVTPGAQTVALFSFTVVMLFGPKVLAVIDLMLEPGGAARYGGGVRLITSVVLECLFSIFLAPILMLFHSTFVLGVLSGRGTSWGSQRRSADGSINWREAAIVHGSHTLVGVAWTVGLALLAPQLLPWLSPVLVALVFSTPFSILTSRPSLGEWTRRQGWFNTPEEIDPPTVIVEADEGVAAAEEAEPAVFGSEPGLARAVLDPYINAIHLCLLRRRTGQQRAIRRYFERQRERLLTLGPNELTPKEKNAVLSDADSMEWLHREVWRRSPAKLPPWWQQALRAWGARAEVG